MKTKIRFAPILVLGPAREGREGRKHFSRALPLLARRATLLHALRPVQPRLP